MVRRRRGGRSHRGVGHGRSRLLLVIGVVWDRIRSGGTKRERERERERGTSCVKGLIDSHLVTRALLPLLQNSLSVLNSHRDVQISLSAVSHLCECSHLRLQTILEHFFGFRANRRTSSGGRRLLRVVSSNPASRRVEIGQDIVRDCVKKTLCESEDLSSAPEVSSKLPKGSS